MTKEKVGQSIATGVFNYCKGTSPLYVNEIFIPSRNTCNTRSQMALEIVSNLDQKSISFIGKSIWNKLSNNFKVLNTTISFTHNYKKLVLQNLSEQNSVLNITFNHYYKNFCYSCYYYFYHHFCYHYKYISIHYHYHFYYHYYYNNYFSNHYFHYQIYVFHQQVRSLGGPYRILLKKSLKVLYQVYPCHLRSKDFFNDAFLSEICFLNCLSFVY